MPTKVREVETVVEVVFNRGNGFMKTEVFTQGDSFVRTEEGALEVYDSEYNVIALYAPGAWIRAAETTLAEAKSDTRG